MRSTILAIALVAGAITGATSIASAEPLTANPHQCFTDSGVVTCDPQLIEGCYWVDALGVWIYMDDGTLCRGTGEDPTFTR